MSRSPKPCSGPSPPDQVARPQPEVPAETPPRSVDPVQHSPDESPPRRQRVENPAAGQPPRSAPDTRPSEHQQEESSTPHALPDTFAQFIAEGDQVQSPANFLTSFFRSATDSLGNSIHVARETGTEALSNAQNVGSSTISAVSGIVRDIGNGIAENANQRPSPPSPSLTSEYGHSTRQGRTLRLSSEPLLFCPPDRVVCSRSLSVIPSSGRIVEQSISPPGCATEASSVRCATTLPPDRIVLGMENRYLRVLSLSDSVPSLLSETTTDGSVPTVLCGGERILCLGTQNGETKIINVADMSLLSTVRPPSLRAVRIGAAFRHAPVSCLDVVKDALVLVGYEDGAVTFFNHPQDYSGYPFVAHARKVSDSLLFYEALAVTIGDSVDPSLAVFDAYTGRCFVRRMLPYAPYSLTRGRLDRTCADGMICQSDMSFMLGGEEGQLEVFRIAVLSPQKIDLELIKTFSNRSRGKHRAVKQASYVPSRARVISLSVSGELRHWQVSKEDGCRLALLEEEIAMTPKFTEANIVMAADQDFSLPDGDRLNSVGSVIKAQDILAGLLDYEQISEVDKDRLVTEFQAKQAAMLLQMSQGDTEHRRARRRIVARFDEGLNSDDKSGTITEMQLARAAKRTAAFEIEFATRRHAERFHHIQDTAIGELKAILQGFVKSLPQSISGDMEHVKRDIDMLGQEDEVLE